MRPSKDKNLPFCFGKLEVVFPMGDQGLRESPESCRPCKFKTDCLRSALGSSDGIKVKEEKLNRAYDSGMISFFQRWSRKKTLQNQLKMQGRRSKNDRNKGEEDGNSTGH